MKSVMTHRLILPLVAALSVLQVADACAQGAFPAPLPGQAAPASASPFPPVNGSGAASPFPPVNSAPAPSSSVFTNGAAPVGGASFGAPPPQAGPSAGMEVCQNGFLPLRKDAEKKAAAIRAASEHKATPQEACKLFGAFAQAEVRMINYVEANARKCGIPPEVGSQLKKGHVNTEKMQTKVCSVAAQMEQRGPAGPSLSEALGSAAALPEAKPTIKGGSTFDTLSGNVLTR